MTRRTETTMARKIWLAAGKQARPHAFLVKVRGKAAGVDLLQLGARSVCRLVKAPEMYVEPGTRARCMLCLRA
jgi:hypothetical protein